MRLTIAPSPVVLIYDGSCGFCSRSVRWIKQLDAQGRVLALPSHVPGLIEAYGLTREQVDRAAWTVDVEGRKLSGAAAINRVLAELSVPWSLLGRAYWWKPLGWLEELVYRAVANHRRLLSRWWGESQCGLVTTSDRVGRKYSGS